MLAIRDGAARSVQSAEKFTGIRYKDEDGSASRGYRGNMINHATVWSARPPRRIQTKEDRQRALQGRKARGRLPRHSRAIAQEHQGKPQTIAPSPKRRWDKPSGRNFASYDELYQSMLPFSSSKGAQCYRNHCLSCLAI